MPPSSASHPAASKSQSHVLLVDGNVLMLPVLRRLLEREFKVTGLESGKKALEFLTTFMPDVIFVDMLLADMPCEELIIQIEALIPNSQWSSWRAITMMERSTGPFTAARAGFYTSLYGLMNSGMRCIALWGHESAKIEYLGRLVMYNGCKELPGSARKAVR